VREGDILTAKADLITQTKKIGNFQVIVLNQHHEIVAVFKGICYRTDKKVVE